MKAHLLSQTTFFFRAKQLFAPKIPACIDGHTQTYLLTDSPVRSSILSCGAKHSVTLTVLLYLMIQGYDLAYLKELVTDLQAHTLKYTQLTVVVKLDSV